MNEKEIHSILHQLRNPYGHGEPQLRQARQDAATEIERLREFLSIWVADGSLQTFEHREKFRAEAKSLLGDQAAP